ncbi:MAG TPA: alpha/beta hydrolase [Chryseolinea sp.]|nr:alpha/beta hydrolase [Chryseolinea sp.]HPM30547.1 alpha/beta hydrolase [Chryseolinea sp.]
MSRKKDKTPFPLKVVRWIYPKVERTIPILAHTYFLRLFFTPLRYGVPEKEKKAESFAEKFTLDVADKKIQCYRWGKGKPVLFIHGWAGRATQFRRFVKPLIAAGYQVIGFDGPAHGNSTGKRTSILEFEETLKAIYKKVGEPAAIIAHSFGGGAALFAAMNGLKIHKLINIASPTIGDEIIHTYLKAINGSMATKDFFKKEIMKEYGKPFDEFTALHFIRHLPEAINLLLVHDQNDKEVSFAHAEALVKVYPASRLIKTKGLGHTRILKDNDVIQQCVTFIRGE